MPRPDAARGRLPLEPDVATTELTTGPLTEDTNVALVDIVTTVENTTGSGPPAVIGGAAVEVAATAENTARWLAFLDVDDAVDVVATAENTARWLPFVDVDNAVAVAAAAEDTAC
jgi:hypothetical protein